MKKTLLMLLLAASLCQLASAQNWVPTGTPPSTPITWMIIDGSTLYATAQKQGSQMGGVFRGNLAAQPSQVWANPTHINYNLNLNTSTTPFSILVKKPYVYVGTGDGPNGIFRSNDVPHLDWMTNVTPPPPPGQTFNGALFHAFVEDQHFIYAGTARGTGPGKGVWQLNPQTGAWNSCSAGLSAGAMSVNKLAIWGNEIYAATTDGIWHANHTTTLAWTRMGLAGQNVTALIIADGKYVIGGTGNGKVYHAALGTTNFIVDAAGLPTAQVNALRFFSNTLYAGTSGSGAMFQTTSSTSSLFPVTWKQSNVNNQFNSVLCFESKGNYFFAGTDKGVWEAK